MRRVLEHFTIEGAYGWNQDWFPDFFMRMGGCAAVTACDSCVYLTLRKGIKNLIDFDPEKITRADYLRLSRHMKRGLGPRMRGVDRLEIYRDGFAEYLRERGVQEPKITFCHGTEPFTRARECLIKEIDAGYPVPFLLLHHADPAFDFYVWHWFLLMGYDDGAKYTNINKLQSHGAEYTTASAIQNYGTENSFQVQAVTYGSSRWLNFRRLWDTGYSEKGGMILFS